MVLVYLPTKLGDFVRANVGKYTIHGAYGYNISEESVKMWLSSKFLEVNHHLDSLRKSCIILYPCSLVCSQGNVWARQKILPSRPKGCPNPSIGTTPAKLTCVGHQRLTPDTSLSNLTKWHIENGADITAEEKHTQTHPTKPEEYCRSYTLQNTICIFPEDIHPTKSTNRAWHDLGI